MLKDGRYAVYNLRPSDKGETHKQLASVFALKNGGFHLLEDHANVFAGLHEHDGEPPSPLLDKKIKHLIENSAYTKVVPTKEDNIHSKDERHKNDVEPIDLSGGRQIFSYKHQNHDGIVPLVYENGSFNLNGYPLSIDELKHLREEVESGNAHVKYPDDMFKAEDDFDDLSKATLYHGTIVDHEPSIKQIGVIPRTGEFIQDAYGDEEMENVSEDNEMSFWADKHTFDRATTAMMNHIARKLGKGYHQVTKQDVRNHGLLVIAKDHEPDSHKQYSGWGMGRAPPDGNEYYNWEKPNPYIEPKDIFSTDPVHANITLKGSKLVSFLERMHGQKKGTQHPSKLGKAEDGDIIPDEGESIEKDDPFFDQDYMVPDIGNLHSYRKFVSQDHKGFHIYLVSDAVKEVLEKDGVKEHNDVTIAISRMINDAASLPEDQGKTFRIGHDSYYVYFSSYESALQFLHNLDSLVRELPTLYSKHPYFDVGIGDDIENAYHALTQVEQMKTPDKSEGNHVLIHTDSITKYISPDDIF
jgi:hypothetical protein